MKKIAIVIGILLVTIGLVETIDLSFYLMNRPDTYLFNLGLVLFGLQLLGFAAIGGFMYDLVSRWSKDEEPEVTTEETQKSKKKSSKPKKEKPEFPINGKGKIKKNNLKQ
jgi:hypothetical protein